MARSGDSPRSKSKRKGQSNRTDAHSSSQTVPKPRGFLYQRIDDEIKQIRSAQRARRRLGVKLGPADLEPEDKEKLPSVALPGSPTRTSKAGTKRGSSNQGIEEVKSFITHKGDIRRAEERAFIEQKRELQKQLNVLRQKFNSLKHRADKKKLEHETLQNEILVIEREASSAGLKTELERLVKVEKEALINTEEEVRQMKNYDKTMQQMAERLWRERHTYEKTLRSYEEVLRVRREELVEMKDMVSTVHHLKEDEERLLEKTQRECKEKLDMWNGELAGREKLHNQQEEMQKWFQQKHDNTVEKKAKASRKEIAQSKVVSSMVGGILDDANIRTKLRNVTAHVNAHEEAFRKIQMATGLSNEDEIVDRYMNRQQYIKEINDRIDRLKSEIDEVKERNEKMKERLNATKYSGGNGSDFNRELIDDLTTRFDAARLENRRAMEEHARLKGVTTSIRFTINSLFDVLSPVQLPSVGMEEVGKGKQGGGGEQDEHGAAAARRGNARGGHKDRKEKDQSGKALAADSNVGQTEADPSTLQFTADETKLIARMETIVQKVHYGIEQLHEGMAQRNRAIQEAAAARAAAAKNEGKRRGHRGTNSRGIRATRGTTSRSEIDDSVPAPVDDAGARGEAGLHDDDELDDRTVQKLQRLIESSVTENVHNIRVPTTQILDLSAPFPTPVAKKTRGHESSSESEDESLSDEDEMVEDLLSGFASGSNNENMSQQQLRAQFLRKRLKARALREGSSYSAVVAEFKRIPHGHLNRILPRSSLKKASLLLYQSSRKVKTPRAQKRSGKRRRKPRNKAPQASNGLPAVKMKGRSSLSSRAMK